MKTLLLTKRLPTNKSLGNTRFGLTLSIIGFKKAQRWEGTRGIKGLAIAGIILNTLGLIGAVVGLAIFHGG